MKNQLCVDIINITRELYRSYAFLEIPKEEFQNLMKEVVKSYMSSKQARRSKTPEIFFKKCFEYELHVYMGQMMTSEEKALELINLYFKNFCMTGKPFDRLKMFIQFLGDTTYPITSAVSMDLIEKNTMLNDLLQSVIESGFLKKRNQYIKRDPILINFLKTYCMKNHIAFEIKAEKRTNKIMASSIDTDGIDMATLYFNDLDAMDSQTILTCEEERELSFRILKGDQKAKKIMIERNLILVLAIIRKDLKKDRTELDLVQEGNMGLIKAVEMFDVTLGNTFLTYATMYIKGYILRFITSKNSLIRIPDHWISNIKKCNDFCDCYHAEFRREPTVSEIAKELQLSKEMVRNLQASYQFNLVSLDQPYAEDLNGEQSPLIELISSDNNNIEDWIFHNSLSTDFVDVLSNCGHTDREIEVADLYYGQGLLFTQIARSLNSSRQRVEELKNHLIGKFRRTTETEKLADYMDEPDKMRSQLQGYQAILKGNEEKQSKIETPNITWTKLYASLFTEIFGIIKKLDSNTNQTLILTVQQLLVSFEQLLSDCSLTREEIELLRMRYFNVSENLSFAEIGTLYDISRSKVSKMVNMALEKLESPENVKKINEYKARYEKTLRMLNAYRKYYQVYQFGELKTYDEFVYTYHFDHSTIFEKVFFKK